MNFPGVLYSVGSRGDEVAAIQRQLNQLGFNVGTADGIFGQRTESAVIAFQKQNNLNSDGIVGRLTWDKLFDHRASGNHPFPGTLIGTGSRGEQVVKVQQRLNSLGYNAGVADGIFGQGTRQAVINFQSDYFLSPDGIVGELTWNALFNGVSQGISAPYPGFLLRVGSRGEEVKIVQNQLNRLGFNVGTADGIFGSGTEQGVKDFQTSRNLQVDGIVGQETWNRLMSSSSSGEGINNNVPYPGVLLSLGATGDLVRSVQRQLNSNHYNAGVVDGIFGGQTQQAVMNFQRTNGLSVDGIVGRLTWDVLFRNNTTTVSIPYPGYLISSGSSGNDVRRIQERLINMGYSVGAADGIFGPITKRAVESFQRDTGLDVDGIVGRLTWNQLFNGANVDNPGGATQSYPGVLLSTGSSGDSVRAVQRKLQERGYYHGVIDGIFGSMTDRAVRSFQHAMGLQVDGIVGRMTWNALFSVKHQYPIPPDYDTVVPGHHKIFIDAGHGGHDPGAVGNGLREKDIALAISLYQKEALEDAGYSVMLSRSTDRFLSLKERTDKANAWGADLFISNHVNAGGGRGSEVWCSIYGGVGRSYAERIANNLSSLFYNRGVKTRQGANGDYLHVIRESRMPAVLVEHGFIDNAGDARILASQQNLRQAAMATVNAIRSVSPPPREDSEISIKNNTLFTKLFNLDDRLKPNVEISHRIAIPPTSPKVTGQVKQTLHTSDRGITWSLDKKYGLDKEQLVDFFAGKGMSTILKELGIDEVPLALRSEQVSVKNGDAILEVRADIGVFDPNELASGKIKFNHFKMEVLLDPGFRGWKVKETLTLNGEFDYRNPPPNIVVEPSFIAIVLLLIMIVAAASSSLVAAFAVILLALGAALKQLVPSLT
ncbi:peptidoglycan-binding protein [Halalkalibacterium halodurans]|uniref:BH1295 protein n=1 Tax=Halalkalibacterium halodurans (strain ATCC BAA-125 / DSM 18197 / FERM 7344 / JCM 9153 / C-125) TaxID=272558 RepID=Q9KDB8_HALH5|nr:peptidoglycan-binding protein [Halalkalibacterium halodurans]MDY7221820.1 peptidoglycan-binding protein [Halalkalibacterium halodurans]MDY7241096.1 peptidoglycan-binding protein [Halalkalibacterium halodurans]MED4122475.1 peptidoglycan-binding protein [Halalkalibacterium halodurans]MED4171044.1 peptidoglycan-binding protein [Halalkalibacterium halodurans]BAB05014.1 BH1295 [Halalkalibacterium halodurans C-125]